MDQYKGGEWSGLVGVGVVDADVEGLIRYLPEEGAGCLYATILRALEMLCRA